VDIGTVKVTPTAIPDVLLIEPRVSADARGQFLETFNAERYLRAGIRGPFVQDNVSKSGRGVLRGLHFQHPHDQGKLVGVIRGEVFDVAVDIRPNSATFLRWVSERLSDANARQLYIPPGFAHGFLALSEGALFAYKCTDYYHPESERSIRWDDPQIGIEWPMDDVILSNRDRSAPLLAGVDHSILPRR
jgi:dTDP-4-dehydrorhamnose 3,5-epimerase